jgi:hypothetical protein
MKMRHGSAIFDGESANHLERGFLAAGSEASLPRRSVLLKFELKGSV